MVGTDEGSFMVRKRQTASEWVLSVVYQSKPTHHLTSKGTSTPHYSTMIDN